MTVYVDDMFKYPMGEFKRGPRTYKMSHMIADTLEELHAMADRIGVERRWFQNPKTMNVSHAHYDITMTKRALAVKAGAVEITLRELAMKNRALRSGSCSPSSTTATSQSSGELVPPAGDDPASPA